MSDPRRFYIQHNYACPECRCVLRFEQRRDMSDAMILVHDTFPNGCSRNGKMYYAPVVELQPFSYELAGVTLAPHLCPHGKSADETCAACGRTGILDAIAPPVQPYICPCDECHKARAAAAAARRRPPFETFKGATCKGSYSLGSACGHCERCTWEKKEMGL